VYDYDLLVIGSGPGGQKAAIAAAKLGKRVAVAERRDMIGGVCVNTGTIPSKTLREAVLYLTGFAQRAMYGVSYRVKSEITIADLLARTQHVVGHEVEVIRNQLIRNHVDILGGTAQFEDPHTVTVHGAARGDHATVTADKIVIATGTRPARPPEVEFDDEEYHVVDSDAVVKLKRVPASMVVVGAGVIGIEYASMFAALGTRVTVVEKRSNMLEFCDPEVVESLKFHLRDQSVTFRFGEEVSKVENTARGTVTSLVSGKKIPADMVMYSAGRQGVTDELHLDKANLTADGRGRISVDEHYRRLAAYHAFGEPARELHGLQPIGIYTVPEISFCGKTEAELTDSSTPYEVGMSRYRELARGAIVGDSYGMLKLLVSTEDRTLLGVHVFGTNATDLVHIGQAIMGCGGTVDYLVDTVLNYPTLSEAYKVAALDVTNKIRALEAYS
jgi:NAD(P) transhydrogenase